MRTEPPLPERMAPDMTEADEQGPAHKRQRVDEPAEPVPDGPNNEAEIKAQKIQDEISEVDAQLSLGILELSRQAAAKRQPIFERRNDVLATIHGFWFTVLSMSGCNAYISEEDKDLLSFLERLDVHEDEASGVYTITLTFKARNPFFANTTLERTLKRDDVGQTVVHCSAIEWYEGKDLQQTINPATGLPEIDQYTFLNWFTTEGVYEEVGGDPIAEIIRNQIWGDPLSVYYAEVVEVSDHEGSEHSGEEIEAGADGAAFDEEHKDEGDSAEESAPEDDDEDGGDDDGVEDDDDEEEDDAL